MEEKTKMKAETIFNYLHKIASCPTIVNDRVDAFLAGIAFTLSTLESYINVTEDELKALTNVTGNQQVKSGS